MWFLVVIWLHYNTPNMVIDFESQETCQIALNAINADIENERRRIEAQLQKDGGNATYNPRAKAYCFKR